MDDVHQRFFEAEALLGRGDPHGVDAALALLETDPYVFRSGYARRHLVVRLARAAFTAPQQVRARAYVLACVDGQLHCGHPELGRLAGAVADNRFRRQLRARLHGTDTRAAAQALRVLPHVRHPGLTPDDHRVAQRLLLHEVATVTCLLAPHRRAARLLWTREWAEELQETTRHHGPDRTAAKQLLALFRRRPAPDAADQRRSDGARVHRPS